MDTWEKRKRSSVSDGRGAASRAARRRATTYVPRVHPVPHPHRLDVDGHGRVAPVRGVPQLRAGNAGHGAFAKNRGKRPPHQTQKTFLWRSHHRLKKKKRKRNDNENENVTNLQIQLTTLSDAKALISRKAITEASNVHWRRQIFESLDSMGQHLMSISSTDGAREWLNNIPRWPQLQPCWRVPRLPALAQKVTRTRPSRVRAS